MCDNSVNYLLSEPSERRYKRELVARFRLDKMPILPTVLRDSLCSNRSSHRLRRRTQSSHFIANLLAIATLYGKRADTNSLNEITGQARNEGVVV